MRRGREEGRNQNKVPSSSGAGLTAQSIHKRSGKGRAPSPLLLLSQDKTDPIAFPVASLFAASSDDARTCSSLLGLFGEESTLHSLRLPVLLSSS